MSTYSESETESEDIKEQLPSILKTHSDQTSKTHILRTNYIPVLLVFDIFGCLVKYSSVAVLINFITLEWVDINKFTFETYYNIIMFVCSILVIFIAWMTDSYSNRVTMTLVTEALAIISVAAINALLIYKIINDQIPWQLFMGLLLSVLFLHLSEPSRITLLLDQIEPQKTYYVRLLVFMLILLRLIALLASILLIELNKISIYFLLYNVILFLIFVAYFLWIIIIRDIFQHSSMRYRIIELCLKCATDVISKKHINQSSYKSFMEFEKASPTVASKFIKITILLAVICPLVFYGCICQLLNRLLLEYLSKAMNHDSWFYVISPNVILTVIKILSLLLSEFVILPIFRKLVRSLNNLEQIVISIVILFVALVTSFHLESVLQSKLQFRQSSGITSIRIYNTLLSSVTIKSKWTETMIIPPLEMQMISIMVNIYPLKTELQYASEHTGNVLIGVEYISASENEILNYILTKNGVDAVEGHDPLQFGPFGTNSPLMSRVYVLASFNFIGHITLFQNKLLIKTFEMKLEEAGSEVLGIISGIYNLEINTTEESIILNNVQFKTKGVYSLFVFNNNSRMNVVKVFPLQEEPDVSFFLVIIIMCLLSLSEAFSVVSLFTFTYMESPAELRTFAMSIAFFTRENTFGMRFVLGWKNRLSRSLRLFYYGIWIACAVLFIMFVCQYYVVSVYSEDDSGEEEEEEEEGVKEN